MIRLSTLALALALTGCGGQVSAKPINICLQPSDRIVAMANCDYTIQPIAHDDNIVAFVAKQMMNPGKIMMWIGQDEWRNRNFRAIIEEAKKYADRIEYIYIVDEMNLCKKGPCLGRDDALVREAITQARAAGFKTALVFTPSVIFADGFVAPDVDVVGIDPYPVTIDPNQNMHGCSRSANMVLSQWLCSVERLHAKGHVKADGSPRDVVYVGQGFGLVTDTHEYRMAYLRLQAEAYLASGAKAVMSWGLYLSPEHTEGGKLVPLGGTQYEWLVTP